MASSCAAAAGGCADGDVTLAADRCADGDVTLAADGCADGDVTLAADGCADGDVTLAADGCADGDVTLAADGCADGDVTLAAGGCADGDVTLTAAQRARIERQRQRARALHDARLVHQHQAAKAAVSGEGGAVGAELRARDTGGGFLLAEPAPAPRAPAHPPAPLVHRSEQPHCLECERPFPASYLFDTFDYGVCDGCRDDAGAHALVTRTEAKHEYLLKDCDLDKREPPLRCVRRRNPHKAHYSDMRLYLRAQVEARALEVWGDEAALEAEREARARRRAQAQDTSRARRLRELRLAARSSLLEGRRAARAHAHAWGPEAYDADSDTYSRRCTSCGHTETYEKM